MKSLIIGCGYLGQALGSHWLKNQQTVMGWVRNEESRSELLHLGIEPFVGDVSSRDDWQRVPRNFSVVIHCASSSRGGPEVYRSVYVEGLRLALEYLPTARFLFVSSSSVYGQNDGSEVTESSPANPTSETSQVLREAEELGLRSGAIVLRAAGIYGPDRGVLWKKFLQGQATIEGDGNRCINQIHRDDLVTAIDRLADYGQPGEIYNIVDDEPSNYLEFYRWLAKEYQLPLPPFGPVNAQRKRGLTNKRVLNAKLKSLGWKPQYPSFREGLRALSSVPI